MNNVVKLLFSIGFIKLLTFISILAIFIPLPAFIRTIIITSYFSFISIIVLLLRLPPFMFSGIVKYKSVRFFYDTVFSIGIIVASLFSGSITFNITAVLTSFIFTMFLESYQEQITKIQP